MARQETWDQLRYFKKDSKVDRWGDPDAISDIHLLRLDDFRDWIGVPIYVLHAVKTGGHKPSSFHYEKVDAQGGRIAPCATDIIIPDYDQSAVDLIFDAARFGFTGIGYYPHWRYKGKMVGGLHLDSRPLQWDADKTVNYSHSRWMGVWEDNRQKYIALDFPNILKYTQHQDLVNKMH
jgi:hypothetical protein